MTTPTRHSHPPQPPGPMEAQARVNITKRETLLPRPFPLDHRLQLDLQDIIAVYCSRAVDTGEPLSEILDAVAAALGASITGLAAFVSPNPPAATHVILKAVTHYALSVKHTRYDANTVPSN